MSEWEDVALSREVEFVRESWDDNLGDNNDDDDDDVLNFLFFQRGQISAYVVLFGENPAYRAEYFLGLVSIANALVDAVHNNPPLPPDANFLSNSAKSAIFKYKEDYDQCAQSEEEALFGKIVGYARSVLQQALDVHRDSSL